MPVFMDGHSRGYDGLCAGRLGDWPVVAGATAWTTGFGKHRERHNILFACVHMPAGVAELFPSTSCTRFLRGIIDVELDDAVVGAELRLESIDLDTTCNIQVGGDPSDVRWRELFTPVLMLGLAERYDVQWQQRGRTIVFCAGGRWQSRAPVETMDTLCLGAHFVVQQFIRAAQGDVPRESLAAEGA